MPNFLKLIVKEVKRETKDAVSILFNVPEELKPNYTFIAGQYINLRLTLDNTEIRRAYSICSAPGSGELRIAVKAVKDGAFSQFANSKLKAGDVLEVGKPEGKFIFEPESDRQKNYIAFVAGSGITPVLSIIKSVLKSEPKSSFTLVYGNKSPEETIFHQELHDLQLQYVGRLFVDYVYSRVNAENALFGRIDKAAVNYILNTKHSTLQFDKFYLCGPEEMINTVSNVLKEKNVKESAIKFELFTSSTQENHIKESLSGHSKITVIVDDEETTFEMSQKQSILDASLKQGIDAPYSCQGGNPEVIILDEPFANLDPTTVIRLKKIIKELSDNPNVTVLVSSHDLQHTVEVCDRIVALNKGELVKDMLTSKETLQELELFFAV